MVNRNKNQVSNNKNNKNKFVSKKAVISKPVANKEVKLAVKPSVVKEEKVEEDNSSDDDISEEELKKMLGTSDNSDIDSDEFSEEEEVQLKESKVNRKRKLSLSDEEEDLKKSKKCEEEIDDEEDDEDDEDDEDEDDSFIDDEEENDDDEEESDNGEEEESKEVKIGSEIVTDKKITKEKKEKKEIDPEILLQLKKESLELKEKKMALVREMFVDTPKIDNDKLKKQIRDRLKSRMERTVVISAVPHMFTNVDVKTLIPNMISCVMPYSTFFHRNVGTIYVDMKTPEEAAKLAESLHKTQHTVGKIQTRKLGALIQTKMVDDVDKYNCQRLVISNLHKKVTLEEIKAVLTKAIRIEIMPQNAVDRKANKTAFAEYANVADSIADYDSKHGADIKGCPINLKFQVRSVDNVKTKQNHFDKKRLTLFGVKKNTRAEEIKKLFPQAIGISLTLEKGAATIKYGNEAECAVDKANAIKNKPSKKWRISFAMGQTTEKAVKMDTEDKEETEVETGKDKKKFEKKKFEGKKFEGKKFEGKKFEKKKFDGVKTEEKNVEGKKFEGKKFEGKKFEGKKFEKKKFDEVKKEEGKKFEGKGNEGKKRRVIVHPKQSIQGAPKVDLEIISKIGSKKKHSNNKVVNVTEQSPVQSDSTKIDISKKAPNVPTTKVDKIKEDQREHRRKLKKERNKNKRRQQLVERKLKREGLIDKKQRK